jgi:hypothetical protein
MPSPEAAWERAMTVQEVMLKALSGGRAIGGRLSSTVRHLGARTIRRRTAKCELNALGPPPPCVT